MAQVSQEFFRWRAPGFTVRASCWATSA